jgi:hypothetical protein
MSGPIFVIQLIQDFSLLLLYKNVLKVLKGLNCYKNPPFKQKVQGTHQILSSECPSSIISLTYTWKKSIRFEGCEINFPKLEITLPNNSYDWEAILKKVDRLKDLNLHCRVICLGPNILEGTCLIWTLCLSIEYPC